MNRVLFCGLLLGLGACSSPEPAAPPARENAGRTAAADSVVLVRLADDITLRWSNQRSWFVHDELFQQLTAEFPTRRHQLVALILDTTSTAAVACARAGKPARLRVGDLAFLAVDDMIGVPFFAVFQVQQCVIEPECPHPLPMLGYIQKNRTTIWLKTANYLAGTAQTTRTKNKPAQ